MAKLYTGDIQERGMLKNHILFQRVREAHYLCSDTTTYMGSGKETNMEDKRKQMRTKLHIWSID